MSWIRMLIWLVVSFLVGCVGQRSTVGPQRGVVVVEQEPDNLVGAGWQLEGPVSCSGVGDTVLIGVAVGTYTISWKEVSGYVKPSSESKALVAGGTITFSGTYVEKGWKKTFGGDDWDWGESVRQTVDGGYIIVGGTYSYGAGGDVWLIKVDN